MTSLPAWPVTSMSYSPPRESCFRGRQPTASLPRSGLADRNAGRPCLVPTFTQPPSDEVGARLLPRQPRHEYAADLPHGLQTRRNQPSLESTSPASGQPRTAIPAHIHQIWSRFIAYGTSSPVRLLHLLVSLTRPGPSGSTRSP